MRVGSAALTEGQSVLGISSSGAQEKGILPCGITLGGLLTS